MSDDDNERTGDDATDGVLVVRAGPGANCSSIGSAVEMLFLSATIGAAVLAAVVAAMSHPKPTDAPPTPSMPPDEVP